MAANNDVDIDIVRERVAQFLLSATAPPSLTFHDMRKIAFLRANTGELLDSPLALDGHTKWYQVTGNKVTTLTLGKNLNLATSNSWRLLPEIGSMIKLKHLALTKCWSVPTEIAKLKSLKRLDLICCDDDRLQLPQVEMPSLTGLTISRGTWDISRIKELLLWVSVYVPKLKELFFFYLSRETATLFIKQLEKCEVPNKINLQCLGFFSCNLVEEDAKDIICDLLLLYPMIHIVLLGHNKIASLQTIGEAVLANPPNNILRVLGLGKNPFFSNLGDSNSLDHAAMISLLQYFNRLCCLGPKNELIKPTSEIEYWTKINQGRGRLLIDKGNNIPLSCWPNILEQVYRTSNGGPHALTLTGEEEDLTNDATILYYLVQNGPLFCDQRIHTGVQGSTVAVATVSTGSSNNNDNKPEPVIIPSRGKSVATTRDTTSTTPTTTNRHVDNNNNNKALPLGPRHSKLPEDWKNINSNDNK